MRIARSILLFLVGIFSFYIGQIYSRGGIYEHGDLQSVSVRILNQISQGFGLSLIIAGLIIIIYAITSFKKEE